MTSTLSATDIVLLGYGIAMMVCGNLCGLDIGRGQGRQES